MLRVESVIVQQTGFLSVVSMGKQWINVRRDVLDLRWNVRENVHARVARIINLHIVLVLVFIVLINFNSILFNWHILKLENKQDKFILHDKTGNKVSVLFSKIQNVPV